MHYQITVHIEVKETAAISNAKEMEAFVHDGLGLSHRCELLQTEVQQMEVLGQIGRGFEYTPIESPDAHHFRIY